jgi:N-acetyl-gamma-glutamyl-phosphate reductase
LFEAETQMSTKVFIDGEVGTTGLQIREKLAGRSDIELVSLPGALRKDPAAKRELLSTVDLTILCLPDEAAKEAARLIEEMGDKGPRVIDASSAHRVAPGWVYGFAEMTKGQAEKIRAARKVGNPGCHATGAIALLRPLTEAGLLDAGAFVSIGSVSGYSGGGKSMIEAYESGRAPAFEHYGLGLEHKHMPEILEYSGLSRRPVFLPSVANYRQGILVSIAIDLDMLPARPTGADLRAVYSRHYAGARFIKVASEAESASQPRIEPESLNGTNDMQIHVFASEKRRQAVLMAKFDNLGKGASGAAIQNLEIMLGFAAET